MSGCINIINKLKPPATVAFSLPPNHIPKYNKGMGRPSKITSEISEAVVSCLQAGLTLKAACSSVGVSRVTVWRRILRRNFETTVSKQRKISKNERDNWKGRLLYAVATGCARKSEIQEQTGLTEWAVRLLLDELVTEGVLVCRSASQSASSPHLYFLR